jgi:transcriptional regulator with XRE-family HTH domain
MQEITKENLSICERFFQILDYYGDTRYKFSRESGVSEAVLSNIFNRKNRPKTEIIEILLNKYKAVDANWLLTGKGDMLSTGNNMEQNIHLKGNRNVNSGNNISGNALMVHAPDNRQYYSDSPDVLRAQIEEKDKLIIEKNNVLREKDERLREKDERLREKDAYILELKETIHELKSK